MDIEELVEIVETMALQHSYPGYDVRSLKLGLPASAVNAPVKVFVAALSQDSVVVILAALRWFWDRPGVARRHASVIASCLDHQDEWVRLEAVRTIGRVGQVDDRLAVRLSERLEDTDVEVKKAAAQAIGKLGCQGEQVVASLRRATGDPDIQVKWKAEKALRKLGQYA